MASIFKKGIFTNKTAIVTGGSTGIGRAITSNLASLGCSVVIGSRNEKRLTSECDRLIQETGGNITAIPCDIRDEEMIKNLVSTVIEKYGRIDFLVNNGGGQFISRVENMSLKGWNAVIGTNLTGTFMLTKEVFNKYMAANGGAIINITYANSDPPTYMFAHTCAARVAVDNLTKSLANDWASNGVRINSVAPGIIYSETASKNYTKGGGRDPFSFAKAAIPMREVGVPDDVANCVVFLLSDAARYITGAIVPVDGGSSIYSGVSKTFHDMAGS